jgi:hypothetical protein
MNMRQLLCSCIEKASIAQIIESVSQPCVGMAYKLSIEYESIRLRKFFPGPLTGDFFYPSS